MFVGGSLGSGGAMLAWKIADWQGVTGSAIAVALTASLAPLLLQHDHSYNSLSAYSSKDKLWTNFLSRIFQYASLFSNIFDDFLRLSKVYK